MLPWQHVLHNKKVQSWALIIASSALLHLIFLLILFVWYRDALSYLNVCVHADMTQNGIPVIIMPFEKRVAITPAKKVNAPAKAAKPVKKAAPKTVMVQEKQIKVVKTEPIKQIKEKSKAVKIEPKKEVKKQDEKKELKKEEVIPVAPVEQKSELAVRPESVPEAIYVGRDQADLLELQELIQQEATLQWRPPVGFAKELVCILKVLIDWQGAVASVVVEQSSGVLAYDSSARMAVAHMQIPRGAYTKELCITFKQ